MIINQDDPIFDGIAPATQVWMSHGDTIYQMPKGYVHLASTEDIPIAIFKGVHPTCPVYCFQFHPEVTHSLQGKVFLHNFLYRVAGLTFAIKIPLMMLFAVFDLSACTSTGFQRQNDYPSSECKRLHARGLISLEEQRKCQFGQAFEFKENQAQTETKAAMPCCAKMKAAEDKKGGCCDADMKEGCPYCSGMTNEKGMMCTKKDKSGMSGMDHAEMNGSQ